MRAPPSVRCARRFDSRAVFACRCGSCRGIPSTDARRSPLLRAGLGACPPASAVGAGGCAPNEASRSANDSWPAGTFRAPAMAPPSSVRPGGVPRASVRNARALVAAVAGDEVTCPLEGDAQGPQLCFSQIRAAAGRHDGVRSLVADARHAHEVGQGRSVHFDREELQMIDRPVHGGSQVGVEERVVGIDELVHVEMVEAQQPVGLEQPVLTVELQTAGLAAARRHRQARRRCRIRVSSPSAGRAPKLAAGYGSRSQVWHR